MSKLKVIEATDEKTFQDLVDGFIASHENCYPTYTVAERPSRYVAFIQYCDPYIYIADALKEAMTIEQFEKFLATQIQPNFETTGLTHRDKVRLVFLNDRGYYEPVVDIACRGGGRIIERDIVPFYIELHTLKANQ